MEGVKTQSKFGITANTLKYIAIVAMLIDHLAWMFVDSSYPIIGTIMHFIGRITGPTMFYFAVEGYKHTRNVYKYMLRLFIFALVSYFPFMFFDAGNLKDLDFTRLNVIFTILFGVMAIHFRRTIKIPVINWILPIFCIALSILCDWAVIGVIIILIFDVYRDKFSYQAFAYCLFTILNNGLLEAILDPFYNLFYEGRLYISEYITLERYLIPLGLFLPIILLYFYNGQLGKGGKLTKWSFYIFYPLHLLIIGFIK